LRSVRVIPCLDVRDGRVVKGVNFLGLRDAGDPVALAAHYGREGADELVFLDITASHEGRPSAIALAEKVAEQVFIPFTVGGGLGRIEDIRDALLAGADKVSLNTAALADPSLIARCADRFGAQCVAVALDARRRPEGGWDVLSHGGRRTTGKEALEWAAEAAGLGAGEILLTSMDADGTQAGYDLELTRLVSEAVPVPVIASGGAGSPEDLVAAVLEGGADAVLVASILHDGACTIADLKRTMARASIPVRLWD
jgi:imidazole glycerol-phosphate synthase subunit HisF